MLWSRPQCWLVRFIDEVMLIDRRDGFDFWSVGILLIFFLALALGGLFGVPDGSWLELALAIAVLLLTFATVAWGTFSVGTALALATSVYFVAGQKDLFQNYWLILLACALGLTLILPFAKRFARHQWLAVPPVTGGSTSTFFVPSPRAGLNDYLAVLQENSGPTPPTILDKISAKIRPSKKIPRGTRAKIRTKIAPKPRIPRTEFEITLIEICRCGMCATGSSCPTPAGLILIRAK